MTKAAIGIDFGTTNSSVALARAGSPVQMASFPLQGGFTESYRSLLYLEQTAEKGVRNLKSWTGPEGIERYLQAETKGRLVQSLKSFLSSRTLKTTDVFGRRRSLEELIARILIDLREKAERQFGEPIRSATVGRPVRFVGAEKDDDNAYSEERLREAFRLAGFESVAFEMEPVGAAYFYESTLDRDELILIGDFGGGTSDFSLIHVGPSVRSRGRKASDLLGNSGVGLAGDAFDAQIVKHLVSPALGAGTSLKSLGKILPVPVWVYAKLERWHHLSLLKAKDVLDMLRTVQAQALEPNRIAGLLHLIQEDLGYQLHTAVQKVKVELSRKPESTFRFSDGVIELEERVSRTDFERWIGGELQQLEVCVDSLLLQCGIAPHQVDMVFLTGGSSMVPAVRRVFETRFGADRIRTGDEFTSVAGGLALKGLSAIHAR